MKWLDYFALGGNKQALEEAATADRDITEINNLTAEAIQTPLKSVKKRKVIEVDEAIKEEEDDEDEEGGRRKSRKNLRSARVKRCLPSKKRTQSIQGRGRSKRLSHDFVTPAMSRLEPSLVKPTPGMTPRFDSRVFKTPGLRTPAAKGQVYNNLHQRQPSQRQQRDLPQCAHRWWCEQRVDIAQLNPEALGNIKKLSRCLAQICSSIRMDRPMRRWQGTQVAAGTVVAEHAHLSFSPSVGCFTCQHLPWCFVFL